MFASDLLGRRHPSLLTELRTKLGSFGVAVREIPGTRDIWCRNYMPVPTSAGGFVQFRYAPSYLVDAPDLITSAEVCARVVPTSRNADLIVDGGNVVRRGRVAVVADRMFAENPSWSRQQAERELRDVLEVDRFVVVPVEQGDVLGHADGVLHLVDEQTALVNDYGKVDRGYGETLRGALRAHGIEAVPIPYAPYLTNPAGNRCQCQHARGRRRGVCADVRHRDG